MPPSKEDSMKKREAAREVIDILQEMALLLVRVHLVLQWDNITHC